MVLEVILSNFWLPVYLHTSDRVILLPGLVPLVQLDREDVSNLLHLQKEGGRLIAMIFSLP